MARLLPHARIEILLLKDTSNQFGKSIRSREIPLVYMTYTDEIFKMIKTFYP